MAAVASCPSGAALLAFSSGKLADEELVRIAEHLSQCESCERALGDLGSHSDSLAARLRESVGRPWPIEEPACLRMQQAANAIPRQRDESAKADTAVDAGTGEGGSRAGASAAAPDDEAATAVWTPSTPATIGRYRVRSELGRGGFAAVYLAHDPDLDRLVAIKVPKISDEVRDYAAQWFLHEARSAARLKHPGIVSVYEVGRENSGSCYIVMEYVEGKSLREEMATGKLPAERAIEIVAQAAAAVHYAHKKGLVHRDLKPANILLDSEGRVRVSDFGLALHEDQQRSHAGEQAGTLAYMSPEQVRGDVHQLDGRSDIWALGVILYELLTGRRPFAGTREQLADEILHRPPKPLRQIDDTIPEELERICLKCLAKDSDQRHSSAGDLATALNRWNRPRAGRWIAAAVALVVIMAVTWLAVATWREYQAPRSLNDAMAFEPVDLMDWRPEEIFPRSDGDRYWERSPGARSIRMESTNKTFLGLGTTTSRSFRVQAQMSKAGGGGCAGIFVGLKPVAPRDGKTLWECQVIRVNRMMDDGRPLLERELLWLSVDRFQVVSPEFSVSVSAPILRDSLERSLLEVTVKDGQIVEVKLGNERFPELTDAKKLANWPIPSCDGRLGLMNMRGSTTFSGCTYESLRSKDHE